MSGAIATTNYEFIRRLVYDQSRINLGDDKMELVQSRLQKRLRALGLTSFDEYCHFLESSAGEEELTALIDVISTNVTQFFRETEHFRFLKQSVLPLYGSEAKTGSGEVLRVWSAACSSGQEPYSLAILLADFFGRGNDCFWKIYATDISTRMLRTGAEGIYRSDQIKLPTQGWFSAYFQKGTGGWDGHYRVKSFLRQRVEFRHLNLFDSPYPWTESFQIIFCRNVMIYFDRPTQEQLISRLVTQLVPGGYLFVGHSESLVGIDHGLSCLRPSIYQKTKLAGALPRSLS